MTATSFRMCNYTALAAGCIHTLKWIGHAAGAEEDHSITVPGSAPCETGSIAQRLGRPARHRQGLKFPVGEEPDGLAVRRPEWSSGCVRTRQGLKLSRIERTKPKLPLPPAEEP